MHIGILTSGGNVPGENDCIRNLVNLGCDYGISVTGIQRGWEGLSFLNADDPDSLERNTVRLNKINTRAINRSGETILHTSRTIPSAVERTNIPDFIQIDSSEMLVDLSSKVLDSIEKLKLDVLVLISGSESLEFGTHLHNSGIPVIAIPKTMDNNIFGTDYTIGFSSAVTHGVRLIHQLRTSSGSHERITIVEIFGRDCGETCLITAYLASTDRVLIPEVPFDGRFLCDLLIKDRQDNPSNYAILAVSEGARMIGEQAGETDSGDIGNLIKVLLQKYGGVNTLYQQLGYLLRSGSPDSLDVMVSMNFASLAIDLINQSRFGQMTAVRDGRYSFEPIDTFSKGVKSVNTEKYYDSSNYKPKIHALAGQPLFLT